MSSYAPIDEDKKNLPIFNEDNFNTGDGVILTKTESDIRYLRKVGGTVSGTITISTGDVQIQKGSLYLYNSDSAVYINGHIALSDTYMFAKNYFSIGQTNGQNNFKITQNGSSAFPGSTDFTFTGSGQLNFKYNNVTKFIFNSNNGKMTINTSIQDPDSQLYVNGNTLVEGTITCNSLITSSSLISPGITMIWGSSTIPSGWLICDGASKSKNSYLALWNVIQYTFGGSGNSFNVPNFTDRFPMGATSSIGAKSGNSTATLIIDNLPSHNHSYQSYKPDDSFRRAAASVGDYYFWGSNGAGKHDDAIPAFTGNAGSNSPFSILNPYIKMVYIIKT